MANPGMPDPIPGGDIPTEMPPRPFPGERPLGPDEPSAPYEDAPIDEPVEPGIGPDHLPVAPTDPGIRA
ncbi:hypothetical protein FV228_00745 [Methylobacterium sp. WL18]|uniref:hypothetical protein n=1 Tax=Methylobacterium sp. WL18 TaxID=2603897 RepID=UPI0011CC30B0|nr:hypothetical protein [Methylobacterium sp. WL18]TXN76303.1 hypothetical protein FV228_00745 [Methylobacterium sp. WL18]